MPNEARRVADDFPLNTTPANCASLCEVIDTYCEQASLIRRGNMVHQLPNEGEKVGTELCGADEFWPLVCNDLKSGKLAWIARGGSPRADFVAMPCSTAELYNITDATMGILQGPGNDIVFEARFKQLEDTGTAQLGSEREFAYLVPTIRSDLALAQAGREDLFIELAAARADDTDAGAAASAEINERLQAKKLEITTLEITLVEIERRLRQAIECGSVPVERFGAPGRPAKYDYTNAMARLVANEIDQNGLPDSATRLAQLFDAEVRREGLILIRSDAAPSSSFEHLQDYYGAMIEGTKRKGAAKRTEKRR